jgi:hypothetical protein
MAKRLDNAHVGSDEANAGAIDEAKDHGKQRMPAHFDQLKLTERALANDPATAKKVGNVPVVQANGEEAGW